MPKRKIVAEAVVSACKTDQARAFAKHYFEIRQNDIVAHRPALSPASIPQLLPHIALLEFQEPDVFLVRLAGTGYRERSGMDPTGRNWLDIGNPRFRRQRQVSLIAALSTPCALLVTWEHPESGELIEFLHLPFRRLPDSGLNLLACVAASVGKGTLFPPRVLPVERIWRHEMSYLDIGAGIPASEVAPLPEAGTRRL